MILRRRIDGSSRRCAAGAGATALRALQYGGEDCDGHAVVVAVLAGVADPHGIAQRPLDGIGHRHAAERALQGDRSHPRADMQDLIHFQERAVHHDDARSFGGDVAALAKRLSDVSWDAASINQALKDIAKQVGQGDEMMWVISVAPSAVDGAGVRSCTNLKKEGSFSNLDGWWPRGQCILDGEYKGAKGAPIADNYFRNWVMKSGQYGARFANTHITGDRSIKMMLGMMDQLVQQYGPNSVKGWAFDHCFLVDPTDLPHVAKLGGQFSCYSMICGAQATADAWGEKVAQTYPIPVKSMMKAGVIAAYESDADKDKWKDLQWFIDRKDPKGKV